MGEFKCGNGKITVDWKKSDPQETKAENTRQIEISKRGENSTGRLKNTKKDFW